MKNNETQVARRGLLKALTLGGAAVASTPAEWTKPALKSVLLPAHASATGIITEGISHGSVPGYGYWGGYSAANDGEGIPQSYSMSITMNADVSCGGSGTVVVRDSSGTQVGFCGSSTDTWTNGLMMSFNCSDNGTLPANTISNGELLTFTLTFSGGCSCSWTHNENSHEGQLSSTTCNLFV